MKKMILVAFATVALAGCAKTAGERRSYGNDALPSAEVIAFQAADARLRWRDARIEHDSSGCAVYQGVAADGQTRSERLAGPDGQPICVRP